MARLLDMLKTIAQFRYLLRIMFAKKLDRDDRRSIGLELQTTAAKHGARPAVTFEGESLTWSEMNLAANRLANLLIERGLKPGEAVALMMENRLEFLIAFYGIVKAGGIAAPLNTNLQGRPLTHCVASVLATKVIVGEELVEAIAGIRSELDLTEGQDYLWMADSGFARKNAQAAPAWATDLAPLMAAASTANPAVTAQIKLNDRALYLFTSGTTGLPKAAVLSHFRLLGTGLLVAQGVLGLRASDRAYLCLPLYHGSGLVTAMSAAVTTGSSVFLRRKFSASNLLEEARKEKTTVFYYIGELCRYLLAQPVQSNDANNPITKIFGNGLRPDIWMEFKQRFGFKRIGEFYGASEGNSGLFNILNKNNTIGMALATIQLVRYDIENDEILRDSNGFCTPVEAGQPGLMVVQIAEGTQFEGYTSKEASESKIVRNVLETGDAWFNSGDLISTVDVGFAFGIPHYQFVDRVGDTFRWKGENCSTNEIGELLNQHPQVHMANIYGVQIAGTDGRAGMAAIITEEGTSLDIDSFSRHVIDSLPGYARPIFLRLLPEMDLTGTFKLVKGELREQAFHPDKCKDPIYVLKPGKDCYEPLDTEFYAQLQAGTAGY